MHNKWKLPDKNRLKNLFKDELNEKKGLKRGCV